MKSKSKFTITEKGMAYEVVDRPEAVTSKTEVVRHSPHAILPASISRKVHGTISDKEKVSSSSRDKRNKKRDREKTKRGCKEK